MKRSLLAACSVFVWGAVLQAQTPTITGITGEGVNAACPGGVGFVNGTNLGTSTSIPVLVGTKPAYVINAFSTSLQIQYPVDAPLGATTIKAGTSAPFNITLVQYCPGIPIDNGVTAAFHVGLQGIPQGTRVTSAFPAVPGERISLSATGLGPTNPVFAAGTAPKDGDFSASVVTKPTITVGGLPASVIGAVLSPNNAGFYSVDFNLPANLTSGSKQIALSIGGLTATASIPVTTGPVVGYVSNAATYITAGPRYAVAPGAIFVLKGVNLGPSTLTVDPKPFQNTTLSGTSVAITVNGTTVQALMYYTSSNQLAALAPSNTPVGVGTVAVTYNNQTSPAINFRVFSNAPGIFTVTSDGVGAGIVTYPDYSLVSTTKAANCGGVYTTCGAANPGDVLIIWATGLGPVNGNDASGAGLGVNMTSVPLTVWLGNVAVTASYQGRSGCCIGEDQIVFTVPANAPLGCAVPLSMQVTNAGISNTVTLPIAATGSRTCTPVEPPFSTAQVVRTTTNGPITYAEFNLRRRDLFDGGGSGFQDTFDGGVFQFTIPSLVQPFFFSYLDHPPVGNCMVYADSNGEPDPPLDNFSVLNTGTLTLQGPNGTKTAPGSTDGYEFILSANGTYLTPGPYTLSATGGNGIGAFSTSLTIPPIPVMTSPPPDSPTPFTVTRANGLTVTWSGGSPSGFIMIRGSSAFDNTFTTGSSFACLVSAASGTFTIPPNVLLTLPATNFAQLQFQALVSSASLQATGLVAANVTARLDTFAALSVK